MIRFFVSCDKLSLRPQFEKSIKQWPGTVQTANNGMGERGESIIRLRRVRRSLDSLIIQK
uniref:Uncharacterized protein n=1 Tax=Romanomermis culicivorax TaxID=13658 RepID=A0A915K048_ROMCU